MRCTQEEFQRIARTHRLSIEARGLTGVEQLRYSHNPLRRLWWHLARRPWGSYRSYWVARTPLGAEVFVKVYFGNANPGASQIDADNERLLHAHFAPRVAGLAGVRQVPLIDPWSGDSFACVAFEWTALAPRSLAGVLVDSRLRAALRDLLGALAPTPPPEGWGRHRETHNFALTEHATHRFESSAPFDVDLPSNLAVDANGRLLFHDFEKFQWAAPGLQAAHAAAWLEITEKRRGSVAPRSELARVLAHLRFNGVVREPFRLPPHRRPPALRESDT